MTTPLFLLRCVQLGLSMGDLDFLTIGLVNDMFTERENDECHYDVLADQRDFDRFQKSVSSSDESNAINASGVYTGMSACA